MSSLLCFSIALLHLFSCFNEVIVTKAASTSTCEKRCQQPFGNCLCYCELEESLLATEENTLNLTKAFFPPEDNPPEFVTVTYHFDDANDTIPTQTWYWSAQTSHFLHPFEVFQFLSLFFSKPEPYYTGSLDITVKAECADLSSTDIERLQLLTQRLKLYAERGNLGTSTLVLSDSYFAKAYNQDSLKEVIESDSNRIGNIIICASVFVVAISFILVFLLVLIFFSSKSHSNSEWIKLANERKPVVLSLAVLSGIANAYICSLALSALVYWITSGSNQDLFSNHSQLHNQGPLAIAIAVDFLCLFAWLLVFTVVACAFCVSYTNKWEYDSIKRFFYFIKNHSFTILSFAIICPLLSIIAHSPFIAISYLNDGNHASSIFIYYTIICYIIFGITWLLFHWYQHYTQDEKETTCRQHRNKNDNTTTRDENKQSWCCIGISASLIVILSLFLGLIVVISCYFVLIPINKAISDAPNQILSIYQSGGFIIGSFIVYGILNYFYSKTKDKSIAIGENVDKIHIILQKWLSHPKQQLHQIQQQFNQLQTQVNHPQQRQQQSDQNSQQQKCGELIQQLTELKPHVAQFYGEKSKQMQAADDLQEQLNQLQQQLARPYKHISLN